MSSEDITNHTVKVVLLGKSGVGKTSIISRFTNDTFDPDTLSSLGASFVSKEIFFPETSSTIKFDIWDTAGQEKYRSLAKIFYKDAVVIALVYDITKSESFAEIKEYWVDEIRQNANKSVILALVANKDDLYGEAKVSEKEGEEYAVTIGAIFKRTSALSNAGIDALFQLVGKKYLDPSFDYRAEEQRQREEHRRERMESESAFVPHDAGSKLSLSVDTRRDRGKCGNCS